MVDKINIPIHLNDMVKQTVNFNPLIRFLSDLQVTISNLEQRVKKLENKE